MAIKLKKPKFIWSFTIKKTEDIAPNKMYTLKLPAEDSGVIFFPMGDRRAPLVFQSPLNAVFYAADCFKITYKQAIRSVRTVSEAMDLLPFEYAAIPVLTVMTCPQCGANVVEKELRSTTAVCPKCGARFPM